MERNEKKKLMSYLSVIILVSMTVACSEVKFSPNEDSSNASASEPPPDTGANPVYKTESFQQKDQDPAVDILIVDDNSGSMLVDQQKLGQKFSTFLSYLSGIDWHLGITTTDVDGTAVSTNGDMVDFSGTNSHILTSSTPDYLNKFLNTVVRQETINCANTGTSCPSGNEQPIRATKMAIERRNSSNAGFFRDNVDFVVITLSDEDEKSDGQQAGSTTATEVINLFKSIWGNTKRIDGYGIVIRPGDTNCYNQQSAQSAAYYGTFVDDFAKRTRGVLGSICDADFGPTLATIGQRVRTLLTTFDLSSQPIPSTIRVKFTPNHATTWYLNGKTLEINNPPPAGTKVEVTYQVKQ